MSPRGPKAPPATATYTFPQAGSFKLVCTLHPGMEARVVVKPAGAAVPKTPDQVKAQALLQQNAGWAKGKALPRLDEGRAEHRGDGRRREDDAPRRSSRRCSG